MPDVKQLTPWVQQLYDVRKDNVVRLSRERGGPTSLSKALGHANASFLSHIAGPSPTRRISEKLAREIEAKLVLPTGWLDVDRRADRSAIEGSALTDALRAVRHAQEVVGKEIPVEKFAEVVAMLIDDAKLNGGQISTTLAARLVRLTQ